VVSGGFVTTTSYLRGRVLSGWVFPVATIMSVLRGASEPVAPPYQVVRDTLKHFNNHLCACCTLAR
jgi:hypothetical protein